MGFCEGVNKRALPEGPCLGKRNLPSTSIHVLIQPYAREERNVMPWISGINFTLCVSRTSTYNDRAICEWIIYAMS